MNRRSFIGGATAFAAALPGVRITAAVSNARTTDICDCDPFFVQAGGEQAARADAFRDMSTGLKVTDLKVFGVSLTPGSDRPYVFVKLETNQGLVGWGEGTLEGKAQAAMSCIQDFRDFVVGKDPMQVKHHWQSMYVHSFYRAGPVIGSAISGIDQALWDLRGKALNVPVYQLLGGPLRCKRCARLLSCRECANRRRFGKIARDSSTGGCFVL
jgi:galactonate dehydratase